MKKILSLFLVLTILFCLVGCNNSNDTDNTSQTTEEIQTTEGSETTQASVIKLTSLSLPYNSADGLNPYTVETEMNFDLMTLLYDSLYRLDEHFSPTPILADKSDVTDNSVTVNIKSNVKFSDSSLLTASDVVYSFNLAKSSDAYGEQLKIFTSAYAESNKRVVFKLSSPAVYALSCLTFPIVKSGSVSEKSAVGSGRYYLSSSKLKANKKHVSGEKASISEIKLLDVKSSENIFGTLQIGEINFAYSSLSDCKTQRITASIKQVPLNNLVYLGMRSTKGLLKDGELRKIISHAIDKKSVSDTAFNGYATECASVFNPLWSDAPSVSAKEFSAQEIAKMLDDNDYKYRNDTDKHRKDKNGKELVLTLAVNKNNNFKLRTAQSIQSDLKIVGIDVNIVELTQKELKSAIKKGKYDMYIGEIKLAACMDLSPFFTVGENASYGINKNLNCISEYNKLISGKIKTDEFVTSFNEDTPFVPLCYRMGLAAASNSIDDGFTVCEGDLFCDIYNWNFKG